MSEVAPATLRRAHAEHPISALQSEYSLWTRDPEDGVLAACRELGVGFVAYSPLGRGFLTGEIRRYEDFAADDYRRRHAAFPGRQLRAQSRAGRTRARIWPRPRAAAPAQLALAWVLAQGDDIVPIPGTKRRKYLEQNIAAIDIALDAADLAELDCRVSPECRGGRALS